MKFMKHEEAFTGLEAAIVLIAFVVVAAVFSYVMLGAGFFTSQKSQEVVHSSVDQASSSVEIRGDVFGRDAGSTASEIEIVEFAVALTAGGTALDMNSSVLTFQKSDVAVTTLTHDYAKDYVSSTSVLNETTGDNKWWIYQKVNGDNDRLIEGSELFIIRAQLSATNEVAANEQFNLEIRPATGAALGLKRTAPAQIDAVNVLY